MKCFLTVLILFVVFSFDLSNSINFSITSKENDISSLYYEEQKGYRQQNALTYNFLIENTVSSPTSNISLFKENPYHIFWLDDLEKDDYLVVCEVEGDDLEMFFTFANELYTQENYTIYEGNGFDDKVGTLADIQKAHLSDGIPIRYTAKSSCLTISNTQGSNTYVTLLFRMKNAQCNQCCLEGNNNILQQPPTDSATNVFNFSNTENQECEIIILSKNQLSLSNPPFVFIDSISGGSKTYKIKDAKNGNVFAEINDTDIKQWKNILIYTNALSITLTTVTNKSLISLAYKDQISDVANINGYLTKENPIQNGIFASPSFGGLPESMNDGNSMLYNITSNKTLALNLNVKKTDKYIVALLMMDGEEYLITKDAMLFGKSFQLFSLNDSSTATNFLIEYSLLNINKHSQKDLNSDTYKHVLWLDDLDIDDMITVCSPDKESLQLFVPNAANEIGLSNFTLYDGSEKIGSMESPAFKIPSQNIPRQITSSSGCFRIHKMFDNEPSMTILFKLDNGKTCATPDILQTSSIVTNITATAFPNGECEIILLASSPQGMSPIIYISSIRATSRDIITVRSTINGNVLAQMNGISADNWKDLYFFTPALSFVITKDTSISFLMSSVNSDKIEIKDLTELQFGAFASYAFNGFHKLTSEVSFLNNNKCSIEFSVNYLSPTDDAVTLRMENDNHIFIQNENYTTHAQNVGISSSSNFSISYGIFNCASLDTSTPENTHNNNHSVGMQLSVTQFCFLFLMVFLIFHYI